jgi:hypothetical protein
MCVRAPIPLDISTQFLAASLSSLKLGQGDSHSHRTSCNKPRQAASAGARKSHRLRRGQPERAEVIVPTT